MTFPEYSALLELLEAHALLISSDPLCESLLAHLVSHLPLDEGKTIAEWFDAASAASRVIVEEVADQGLHIFTVARLSGFS